MKTRTLLLTVLSIAALGLGVAAAKSAAATATFGLVKAKPSALQVACSQPVTLRLARFEDGSAQLKCAGHILVRVSVPG